MRWFLVGLALILTACTEANADPVVTALSSAGYASQDRYGGDGISDGYATYRTRVGSRSDIRLNLTWSHPLLVIQFVSQDNWLDHHNGVQLGWGFTCQVDQGPKVITCSVNPRQGVGGISVSGTATDVGTFHYRIRLSDRVSGAMPTSGREAAAEWDEIVTY